MVLDLGHATGWRIWAWSKLVKVWASLRWSDLQAIIPAELVLVEGRLVTTLRWTKTSEELPVAISEHAFILGRDWQKVGFNLLKAHAGYKRDYLMSCWDPGSAARGAGLLTSAPKGRYCQRAFGCNGVPSARHGPARALEAGEFRHIR